MTTEVERLKPFEARVAVLEAENAALKEKLAKSSRNSSKPPSCDGPKERAERRTKKPTGKAAGGQPGHRKHERPAWPAEKVNKRVVLRPKRCEACSSPLVGEDPEPRRHHVFELPKVEPVNGKTLVGDLAFGVFGTDRHGAYNCRFVERI